MIRKTIKKNNISVIKNEITWYEPKKRIADAMLKLGKLGFEFSGHGCGFGCEDFSLSNDKYHVNLCDEGRKVIVTLSDDDKTICEGSIGQVMKRIEKLI